MSFLIRAFIVCPIQNLPCPLCWTLPCAVRHILSCVVPRFHLCQSDTTHQIPPSGWKCTVCWPPWPESFWNPSHTTIPTTLTTTTARPDIVIIQDIHITLLELKVLTNTGGPQEDTAENKISHPAHWPWSPGSIISPRNNRYWHPQSLLQSIHYLPACPPPEFTEESSLPSSPGSEQNHSILLSPHIQCKVQHYMHFIPTCTPLFPPLTDHSFTKLNMHVHLYIMAYITLYYAHPSFFSPSYSIKTPHRHLPGTCQSYPLSRYACVEALHVCTVMM